MPSDYDIDKIITEALETALEELRSVGILATSDDCFTCACNPSEKAKEVSRFYDISEAVLDLDQDEVTELDLIKTNFQHYDFEDLSAYCSEEYKTGHTVKIFNKKTKIVEEIKKTTLCWYLNDDIRKPSTDRKKRFVSQARRKSRN